MRKVDKRQFGDGSLRLSSGSQSLPLVSTMEESDCWWCAMPNCYQNSDPLKVMNADLGLAKYLGVANVRLGFPWAFIEPQPNSWFLV